MSVSAVVDWGEEGCGWGGQLSGQGVGFCCQGGAPSLYNDRGNTEFDDPDGSVQAAPEVQQVAGDVSTWNKTLFLQSEIIYRANYN